MFLAALESFEYVVAPWALIGPDKRRARVPFAMHVEFVNPYSCRSPLKFALVPFRINMVADPKIFSIDLSTFPGDVEIIPCAILLGPDSDVQEPLHPVGHEYPTKVSLRFPSVE